MIENLKFSIIMPCYNSAAYVRGAVDSLLAQQYPNWELIAVNDGSTDSTLEILENFAAMDSRIRVFSKENGGYATAINYGLDRISGDYFLMMGSDDKLASNLLSEIVLNIGNCYPDMIAFRAVKFLNGENIGLDNVTKFSSVAYEAETNIFEFEKAYPLHSKILMLRDTAKCFKTSLLGKLRYFGYTGYDADGIFSTLFSRKCSSFAVFPIDGYFWTLRSDSVSANLSDNKNYDRLCNWISYFEAISKENITTLTQQEEVYIGFLQYIGLILLQQSPKIQIKNFKLIVQAYRCYLSGVKQYHLDVQFPRNPIKRILITKMPVFWCILYRFRTANFRRMENK